MCFYDKFLLLCKEREVTKTRALIDAGLSKSLARKWENKLEKGENVVPNGETLLKLCNYFGVTSDYFLDKEIEKAPSISAEGLTDEQIELVRLFRGADSAYQAAALALLREAEAAHKVRDDESKG